jgi:hypothetical protein
MQARSSGPCPPRTIVALLSSVLIVSVGSFLLWQRHPEIADENAFLEICQATLLLLAGGVHASQASRLRTYSIEFLVRAGLSLLALSFTLCEVDIAHMGDAAIWPHVELALRSAASVLLLVFLFVSLKRIKLILDCRERIFDMPAVGITLVAGLFFMAAWLFDKELVPFLSSRFSLLIGEMLGLNACLILFAASFARTSADLPMDVQADLSKRRVSVKS